MDTRSTRTVVRHALPADASALTAVYSSSWRTAYLGIIPAMALHRAVERRDEAWWKKAIKTDPHLLVIDVADTAVGYASCGRSRCASQNTGEIFELYIAPAYQGLGLGEHLFEACRSTIDRMDLEHLVVWALEDNAQARQFYINRGGRPLARSRERFGTVLLEKIAYVW